MLVTASTVKDSPENLRFFVEANLASGVDHLFVFLDAPAQRDQREAAAYLDEHPHVTCVRAGGQPWWRGDRPANLNTRQRINANWTRAVLEPLPWAEWLLHIDGDEVAHVDREALAAVPAEVDAVWLAPREAVSELRPTARPTRFKRLLDDADLNLLRVLGVLGEATNQDYFHGHVMGKSGVRPRSGLALTLHDVVSPDGRQQDRHRDDRLRLLHYDATSGEEFIRKWTALAAAGPARYRPSRQPTARAMKALITRDLPGATREKYLRRVYELTVQDDVETLADLGLLEDIDPLAGTHSPRALTEAESAALAARVEELSAHPKAPYFVADSAKDAKDDRDGTKQPGSRLRGLTRRS